MDVKERNTYRIMMEQQEGKRPLGRPRRKYLDNYYNSS
jgi:hypothetical protein